MHMAKVQHKVRFGPFRTSHFRKQVDAAFRRAFYSYLDREIIPFLEGDIVGIGGRVHSHYDRPQFNGLPEVKHRYYHELTFHSAAGTEDAHGEVDYDPATGAWTPSRVKPLRIWTLSEKLREKRSRDLDRQISMEARHHQPVRPTKCPRCGSKRVAEMRYGCFVSSDDSDPQWCCLACRNRWGLSARGLARREILKRISGEPI